MAQKLNALIKNFSIENLTTFLRAAIPSFKSSNDDFDYIFDKYESIVKIGEAEINKEDLIVIASKTTESLTERTGKKNQYEIAKNILKQELKDAALFVFTMRWKVLNLVLLELIIWKREENLLSLNDIPTLYHQSKQIKLLLIR